MSGMFELYQRSLGYFTNVLCLRCALIGEKILIQNCACDDGNPHIFADVVLVGRFKVRILSRHSQFCAKFLHIMDKVTIISLFFSILMACSVSGRIYFEGMDHPPESQDVGKLAKEAENQPNSTQIRYQNEPVGQTTEIHSHLFTGQMAAVNQNTSPSPTSGTNKPAATDHRPTSAIANLHHLLVEPNTLNPSELALKSNLLRYIGRGLTEMTLRMQRVLSGKNANIFFAPVSIASALALLLLAAKGQTAKQIANSLGLPVKNGLTYREEETHQILGLFFDELKRSTNNITSQLALANGIFIQSGQPIKSQFRNNVIASYKSDVYSVDFKNNRTTFAINYWATNRTHGRIKSVLDQRLPPTTIAVLINAIYFNGNWEHPFGLTSLRKFFITPTEAVLVPMMQNLIKVPFMMDKTMGVKMIGLPYKGDEHVMYSIIPDGDLDTFSGTLTADRIHDMINRTADEMTIIIFPKMKLTMEIDLRSTLDHLGVKDVFIPGKADLSSLARGISVSEAFHKAEIDVNEVGTTASAVTLASSVRTGVNPTFVATKPFLFFIYHKPTQAISFWGTVYNPNSVGEEIKTSR